MVVLQIACFAIVVSFVFLRARLEARPIALYRRLFLLAVAAWIGEDTCIRAYGFYEYSASWWLFLDKVPLLILLIWPIVLQSARDLASCLWPGRDRPSPLRVGLTVVGLVLADCRRGVDLDFGVGVGRRDRVPEERGRSPLVATSVLDGAQPQQPGEATDERGEPAW